jgi:superoxide dismutase, Fe-Mn family
LSQKDCFCGAFYAFFKKIIFYKKRKNRAMNPKRKAFLFAVVLFITLYVLLTVIHRYKSMVLPHLVAVPSSSENAAATSSIPSSSSSQKRYQPKEFIITMGPKKLSAKQISDHKELYVGYVNKRNEIDEGLQTVDKAKANQSYSALRGLKVAETFARNGALLHELYFENIGTGTEMGQKTQELLIKNFGSVATFKEDLMATAISARGWVLTCYNLDDHRVHNYLLDAHNELVPVLTIPLLAVDTYEHAYMIDFGINRKEYLILLWDNINWNVVEERIKQWIS